MSSSTGPTGPDMVLVSAERLKALEALAARVETEKAERLRKLNEHYKQNPQDNSRRSLRYYEAHKEEISLKRKAAYKKKKSAEAAAIEW